MKLISLIISVLAFITSSVFAQIYVAPNGSDTNPGTMEEPLESIQQAQALASPGDTVYIRGGLYQVREDQISAVESNLFACISHLTKSGQPGKTIKYWAYPGETPVFDFSNVKPANQRVVGIWVSGSYIHIKGLDMTGIQTTITTHTESYCIYSRGNNNIYEQIVMHDNVGTGLRHYNGEGNLFLNCDSYRNWDNVSEDQKGGNNDGFGCHPNSSGTGNVFRGCRAWFNSDDGFDIIRSGASVVFDSCWAFYNGYSTSFASLGDGNGFKAGGYAHDTADKIPDPVPRNTIQFCVAVRNKANGFYSNHHLGGNNWYNNTAYLNGNNFNMLNRPSRDDADNIDGPGYDHVLINNLSYKPYGFGSDIANIDTSQNTLENNSFYSSVTITDDDFVSLDQSELTAPRKADGSLPDIDFLHPAQGSDIIDAGIDIGFDYLGDAPDLGAFEVEYTTAIPNNKKIVPESINLYQNFPNPFNPSTTIRYILAVKSNITLKIYDVTGKEIKTLLKGEQLAGTHEASFDAGNLPGGLYFYRLSTSSGFSKTRKMLLLK